MSLFVAIVPPPHVVEHLQDAITGIRRGVPERSVRWTMPERWHVTLAFLGDPDPAVDEDVAEHLQPLRDNGPVQGARLASAGSFGRQIAWIGLEDGPAKLGLAACARRIPGMLRGTGVSADRRPWRPHLTIARLRSGAPDALVSSLSGYRGFEWDVEAVHLIRSSGGPHPIHDTVASVDLT